MSRALFATESGRLKGRRVALCVTGSIAAVESVKLARELVRHGARVEAYLSPSAMEIITPKALEFATGSSPVTEITGKLEHLSSYDLILLAPATANTISKVACGIGDTPPALLALSSRAKALMAPAMHESMQEKEVVRQNIEKLEARGYRFVSPFREEGAYKLAPIGEIVDHAIRLLTPSPLRGKRVVVTAGATEEPIDEVRVITNKSSGRMGLALSREAFYLGAEVTIIHARMEQPLPRYLSAVKAEGIEEMLEAVEEVAHSTSIFISAGAIGDFFVEKREGKLESRKGKVSLELHPAPKVLSRVKKQSCFKVGFKGIPGAGRERLVRSSRELIQEHGLQMVVANDISQAAGSEENEALLVTGGEEVELSLATKAELSAKIFQEIIKRLGR